MGDFAVTVRMYRQILGDCFLLTLAASPDAQRDQRSHILIDCGVLQGVAGGSSRMRAIVADIAAATDSRLDCVIVTHEHFDHIGGFQYAEDLFGDGKLEIGTLWLAWTEDPADPKGQELQARFGAAEQKMAALRLAIGGAQGDGFAADLEDDPDAGTGGLGLAAFVARSPRPRVDATQALAAGAELRGSRRIYANLRAWASGGTSYLEPGDVLETPRLSDGAPMLTAYVLGPPRDDKFLFKGLPSARDAKETYLAIDEARDPDAASARSPFSPSYRWYVLPLGEPEPSPAGAVAAVAAADEAARDFVRAKYLADQAPCRFAGRPMPAGHQCATDFQCRRWQGHRRIDDMLALDQSALAIKMDSNTNNSSLVIAFELPDATTMIFAADAQVGNWLSWETVKFKRKDSKDPVEVTSAQLLGRARLYKVGHHGSHNATLAAKGLELMTHEGLVAMIPTVEAIAKQQGSKGWLMPNPETYRAIVRQTKGRILRGDLGLAETRKELCEKYPEMIRTPDNPKGEVELDGEFAATVTSELYVEYRLT